MYNRTHLDAAEKVVRTQPTLMGWNELNNLERLEAIWILTEMCKHIDETEVELIDLEHIYTQKPRDDGQIEIQINPQVAQQILFDRSGKPRTDAHREAFGKVDDRNRTFEFNPKANIAIAKWLDPQYGDYIDSWVREILIRGMRLPAEIDRYLDKFIELSKPVPIELLMHIRNIFMLRKEDNAEMVFDVKKPFRNGVLYIHDELLKSITFKSKLFQFALLHELCGHGIPAMLDYLQNGYSIEGIDELETLWLDFFRNSGNKELLKKDWYSRGIIEGKFDDMSPQSIYYKKTPADIAEFMSNQLAHFYQGNLRPKNLISSLIRRTNPLNELSGYSNEELARIEQLCNQSVKIWQKAMDEWLRRSS